MSSKAWFACLLSAFAALLFGAGEAHACSCGRTPSVLNEYESADAVVIARADAVEKARPGEDSGPGGIRSTFREEDFGRSYLFYLKAFGDPAA